jgi:hypothetical protein
MNYGTRTVNHLEGWHSTLIKLCVNLHKNIFEFIRILKDEQRKFENKVLMFNSGSSPKKSKRSTKRIMKKSNFSLNLIIVKLVRY